MFNGPQPKIERFETAAAEIAVVAAWIVARGSEGIAAEEIGIFVRSETELPRAQAAVSTAGFKFVVLDEQVEAEGGCVVISTMHLAKGLECRAVAVMACDDEVCPLQSRVEAVSDEADLEEAYNTERHLLYVACTRAREQLLVTSVKPGSEFLADLQTALVEA